MAYLCDSADEEYNKWEPFNRVQLEARDPETCALLARVWDDGDTDPEVAPAPPPAAAAFAACCARARWRAAIPCLRDRRRDRDA